MNFEVDRYSPTWAHIALCADVTWTTEPPDEFIIANQRLWAQHCRISQILQDAVTEPQSSQTNHCESTDKLPVPSHSQENGSSSGRKSVKDIIPESRLAQFYGNFYYDDVRENCYTSPNETTGRGYNGQSCENCDLTECWMLPEVEYWFRKLVDESPDRGIPRRRRQFRMITDDDFERWGPNGGRTAGEEAALAARVRSVRSIWSSTPSGTSRPHATSPPPIPRKIRARRRQPRRLTALAPPAPAYCLEVPAQLFCDPTCKFQFEPPRPPQLTVCQRDMGRLSANMQAVMRATAARCPSYRGTNVSRYAPTSQRPARGTERRYGVWWPRDHPSPRLDHRFQFTHLPQTQNSKPVKAKAEECPKEPTKTTEDATKKDQKEKQIEIKESPKTSPQQVDEQQPSTSAASMEISLRKKRLYSTVLSMSPPAPITVSPVGCVRLTPGLLKLNPKIVPRIRPNVDKKFEELEKEALEQYKASDESIDMKLRELEKEAAEQYSTSNSNTSCSSGNSGEKGTSSPSIPDEKNKKQPSKFHKAVDSVVIYSQNFPDLNAKAQSPSVISLKNFHTPPRGEKKDQAHRPSKLRSLKSETQRAASDTDNEAREKNHKGPQRWSLHVVPPKKRHLSVSDFSSEDELEDASGSIKDAHPQRNHLSKVKMSAHGAGDLHPIMRQK